MLYLVSYDIPSSDNGDKRRYCLSRFLQGLGLRIQNSVFEVELYSERLPWMISQIRDLIEPTEDNIRVYPLCARCRGEVSLIGRKATVEYGETLIW